MKHSFFNLLALVIGILLIGIGFGNWYLALGMAVLSLNFKEKGKK